MSLLSYIRTQRSAWSTYKTQLRQTHILAYWAAEIFEILAFALPVALLIRQFVVQLSVVPSPSMVPTLRVGDRLFVNRVIYRVSDPHRGDIVVFKSPFGDGRDFVKRCIGVPGDTIQILLGEVYVNGRLLVVPGVDIQYDTQTFSTIQVPTASYFMMGDNRANSNDSRFWGFVPRRDIVGKAFFTVWPFSHLRPLR